MSVDYLQNQLLTRIREMLDRTDTIIFVGSGVSRWSGLPSWYGLIVELASYIESQGLSAEIVKKELEANDLLQAASYGVDLLTKPQFAQFIYTACRVDTAVPHEIHKEILSLGPTCFITTNYDHLLEHNLPIWFPESHFRIVNNTQFTEIANIIQARSVNFIYKPHGDVNDSDSIILTREHYRKLRGEKLHALQGLETLLASRPVLFLGFGLRDLDFLHIKDTLANVYKGGTIDHYAIMANVSEQERTYWRKNYGIHILSYKTIADGLEHQPFLDVLKGLNKKIGDKSQFDADTYEKKFQSFSPDQILAIARYAARVTQQQNFQEESHLPLEVDLQEEYLKDNLKHQNRYLFGNWSIDKFLESYQGNAIVIGNPGAGKTYSLKRSLYRLADTLQTKCLQEKFEPSSQVFPLYLDLKLYDGNLFEMAEQTLPPDFSLSNLSRFKQVKVFLDSYNEVPRIHIENGNFQDDLGKLFDLFTNLSVVIASRMVEGLGNLGFPVFHIEDIDYSYVETMLEQRNLVLEDRFEAEIIKLLQKPLFYRLYQEEQISLSGKTTPIELYQSFVNKISLELKSALEANISLENLFRPLAFELLNDGMETFDLNAFETRVSTYASNINLVLRPLDVINWLISINFLIAAPNFRISFFHQSITEYFAALELSERYKDNPKILDEILKYTRWDQTLFLTLGFLDEKAATLFIQKVIKNDLDLAVKASKYLEHNRDEIILRILDLVIDSDEKSKDFDQLLSRASVLSELPVTKYHEAAVLNLLRNDDNVIGGAASKLLVNLLGKDAKNILIKELFEHQANYNYCSDVGETISKIIDINDFQNMFDKLGEMALENSELDQIEGLVIGIANSVQQLEETDILKILSNWKKFNLVQIEQTCDILREMRTNDGLTLAIAMVSSRIEKAIFPIHLKLSYPPEEFEIDWSLFTIDFIKALIESFDIEDTGEWALGCVRLICEQRKDLLDLVRSEADVASGIMKIALLNCDANGMEKFWEEMDLLSNMSRKEIESEPFHLFHYMNINWTGKEAIFVDLLKVNKIHLASNLLENLHDFVDLENNVFDFGFQPILWWLDWMEKILSNKDKEASSNWLIPDRLGQLLAKYSNKETQKLIIDEFNESASPYKKMLKDWFLSHISNLSLNSFTEESLSYLISDLNNDQDHWAFNVGEIATEEFVEQRLFPLMGIENEPFKTNLLAAIRIAGERNNRRFILQ